MELLGKSWKKVGKVKNAHGLKGDFQILIFSGDTSWLPKLKEILLSRSENGDDARLFKVQRVRPFKDGLILKVEEVGDRTQAEYFKGISFFIPSELLISAAGETIYLSEILNFTVKDVAARPIGNIHAFSSNGPQDLLCVSLFDRQKTVEIPFVKEFIRRIDFKNSSILMDLPEGLLALDEMV